MTDSELPSVCVLMLNWNGWEDTVECLESLYQIDYPNYNVMLVDNGSEDDSIEMIHRYCKGEMEVKSDFFQYNSGNKPVEILELTREELTSFKYKDIPGKFLELSSNRKLLIIKNEENVGFAEGNNIGLRFILNELKTDYILLLNNDTVVNKSFLNELVDVARGNPQVGFAGPKTYYYNYKGRKDVIDFAGGLLNLWKGEAYHIGIEEIDEGQYDEIRKVDYIEGSCLLSSRDLFEKIGLFDSHFFGFFEETDLCLRVNRLGYDCVYVPKAEIWHKITAGYSTGSKVYYLARNRFWFMKKNSNKSQYIIFLLYFFGFSFWIKTIIYSKEFTNYIKGTKEGLFPK